MAQQAAKEHSKPYIINSFWMLFTVFIVSNLYVSVILDAMVVDELTHSPMVTVISGLNRVDPEDSFLLTWKVYT